MLAITANEGQRWLRCAVTEGLGTFWIVPHLAEFSRANPHTIVDLHCSSQSPDVLRRSRPPP